MVLTTIALVPFGIGAPQRLGHIKIANTGTGTRYRGNYTISFHTKSGKVRRVVTVENFPRKSKDVFELLHLAFLKYKEAEKAEKIEKKKRINLKDETQTNPLHIDNSGGRP
jgi:hypothetical protein